MSFQGEDMLVGLAALALLPFIGWRILRGLRAGSLPLYRTHIARSESAPRYYLLLALHLLSLVLIAVVAADLLLGIRLLPSP